MIDEKLKAGRFIKFPVTLNYHKGVNAAKADYGTILNQAPIPLNIQESSGVFTKKSGVGAGTNDTKTYRNFQWLPYIPGVVNQVALGGVDLLTGPMSGCWIMIYTDGDMVKVGHVGTANEWTTEESKKAKEGWNTWAAAHKDDVIGGFKPFTSASAIPPREKGDEFAPMYLGGVNADMQCYSICGYAQMDDKTQFRIAKVQKMLWVAADKCLHLDVNGVA